MLDQTYAFADGIVLLAEMQSVVSILIINPNCWIINPPLVSGPAKTRGGINWFSAPSAPAPAKTRGGINPTGGHKSNK